MQQFPLAAFHSFQPSALLQQHQLMRDFTLSHSQQCLAAHSLCGHLIAAVIMYDSVHRTSIYGSASFIKNVLLKREKTVLSLRLHVLNSDTVSSFDGCVFTSSFYHGWGK